MGIMRWVVFVMAGLFCVAAAAQEQPRTLRVWVTGGVDIDAAGNVQGLEWDEPNKLHALVVKRLAPAATHWEFEPGTVDGQPQRTQTGLSVQVQIDELPGDALALRVLQVRTGPTASVVRRPGYPMLAAMEGASAEVRLVVEVQPDGSPRVVEEFYEGDAPRHSGNHRTVNLRKQFVESSTEALATWKFRPELVAGHVVPGASIRIPFEYCVWKSRWCALRAEKKEAGKLSPDLHVAESSAVALKTDISAAVI